MLEESLRVNFYDTDALQHVSNTALVRWYEGARDPIFRYFSPELDLESWPLIVASYKVDLLKQIFLGDVTIKTGISRIGNSSFVVLQEAWQNGDKCSSGETVMVHYNYETKKSEPIPGSVREKLEEILVKGE